MDSGWIEHDPMSFEKKVHTLFQSYRLCIVYAFGSRAKQLHDFVLGKQPCLDTTGSDIDLAVLSRSGSSFRLRDQVELACDVEDLLGISSVDIVDLSQAPPAIAAQAVMGIVLWTDDPVFEAEFQLYILRKYSDTLPLQRERADLILHHQGS